MLVLVVASALVAAACGSEQQDERGAGTERATASVTPFPSIDRADLVAGTAYTTRVFSPSITFNAAGGRVAGHRR